MNHYLSRPALVLTFLAAALPAQPQENSIPIDGYAAVVNQEIILVSDVHLAIEPTVRKLDSEYTGRELMRKKMEVFNEGLKMLVERSLVVEEFTAQEMQIPDQLVNDRVNEMVRTRFDNDRVKLMEALAKQQMTVDDWREELKKQLTVEIMRHREIQSRVSVSPQAVRNLYEARIDKYSAPPQVKLRVIMLNRGANDAERKVKQTEAEALRKRLVKGEHFDKLAREHSEGSKAHTGGDWGWIEPDDLQVELARVSKSMPVGAISRILTVGDHLFLLLVEARKSQGRVPFEKVRDELERELRRSEGERMYRAWMNRLQKKHYVKYYLKEYR